MKYIKAIRKEFETEIDNPSDEFIKLLVNRFFDRPLTANRISIFREYTKRALTSSINESISSRLKSALSINENIHNEKEKDSEILDSIDENSESKVVTTEDEIEGFQIVKAILREVISADRIAPRDTQSYFGVLLDDNNRKPLCRLHLNGGKKYIELFHNGKDAGEKILINSLDDIYNHKAELQKTVDNYK